MARTQLSVKPLKGQCHEIFDHFFAQKIRPGPHLNRRFHELFQCQRGQWLRWHCVSDVSHYADTVSEYSTNTRTLCQRSQWLRGHGQDYVDTLGKLFRLLTDLKGTIRQKKLLGCIYATNSNKLKIWKSPYLKKKTACPLRHWLRGHAIFELCDRISSWKRKRFAKPFLSVNLGPRSKSKVKNLVTLSL